MNKKVWKYFFQQKNEEIGYWFKNSGGLKIFGGVILCSIGTFIILFLLGYIAYSLDINYILKQVLMEPGSYAYFLCVGFAVFAAMLIPFGIIGGIAITGIFIFMMGYYIFYQPFAWIRKNWKHAKNYVEQETKNGNQKNIKKFPS